MPYEQVTKVIKGIKKFCIINKNTGQLVCYGSKQKRKTGIKMREAFAHGWKPRNL